MTDIPEYFGTPNKLMEELQKLATEDTAIYFYEQDPMPVFIPSKTDTMESMNAAKAELRKVISEVADDAGFVAEFGVNQGASFIQLCNLFSDDRVYGFDAFDGLPDGGHWPGNVIHNDAFKYGGKPPFNVPVNGKIYNGWFENTLPNFCYDELRSIKFLHVDCDVYSSTVTILEHLGKRLRKNSIVVFDDYCNYTGWRQGEFKAWQEFVYNNHVEYEYLYVAGMAVGIKVNEIGSKSDV